MSSAKEEELVLADFESHPPIEADLEGVTRFIMQTFQGIADCDNLAKYIIELKDVTQVIVFVSHDDATEDDSDAGDESNSDSKSGENTTSDDGEPDQNIFGVISVVELPLKESGDSRYLEAREGLVKFLKEKDEKFKTLIESNDSNIKMGLVISERFVNLPPQLALPFLKHLTKYLAEYKFTHLMMVSKIQVKSRNSDQRGPSKKMKTEKSSSKSRDDSLEFVNPEEEIIFESSDSYVDLDVSVHHITTHNPALTSTSDINYIPHRRVMIIDYAKWPDIISNLEKELR